MTRSGPSPGAGAAVHPPRTRLHYIDYLRAGVVALVFLHHTATLALAVWEQVMLVGMSIVLLRWGQHRLNKPSRRWEGWAGASYVAYIIQPLVIVALAVLFRGAAWPALGKFAVVGPLSVVVIYAAARALRQIPPVRRVVG